MSDAERAARADRRTGIPGGARVRTRHGHAIRARARPERPVRAPADKSISHRAALLGAMASEPVRIERYLHAADTDSTLAAVAALGALVEVSAGRMSSSAAPGCARRASPTARSTSATPARCCACCRAGSPRRRGARSRSTATSRSAGARSSGSLTPLRQMGAELNAREDRFPPLHVDGAPLHGDRLRARRRQRAGQVVHPARGARRRRARRRSPSRPSAATTPSGCCCAPGVSISRRGRTLTVGEHRRARARADHVCRATSARLRS